MAACVPAAACLRLPVAFSEYPCTRRWDLELSAWELMLSDGFLSDSTLDVSVALVLINGNTNTLCTAEIRWSVQPTGLISAEIAVVAIPMTLKPQEGTVAGTVSVVARVLNLVLTVVHIVHLLHDWRTRSPLLFSATPVSACDLETADAVHVPTQLQVGSQARLNRVAALEHIGAQASMGFVMIGIIIAETRGDLILPDINMMNSEPAETARVLSKFFAEMRTKTSNIQIVNKLMAFAWILATIKLVRMLDFDPRLSLVSRTVSQAWHELAFFMLSALLIVFGYSLAGSVIFGDEHSEFVTPPSSIGAIKQLTSWSRSR